MNKNVVLVSQDAAPSGCFKRLEPILNQRGYQTTLIIGSGKPLSISDSEIEQAVSQASLVILGMSSSPTLARLEVVAGEFAKKMGIPYGFYGDIPRCWVRASKGHWFSKLSSAASFYLGLSQADADQALEVFPSAKLIGVGNPLREEAAIPKYSRNQIRKSLGVGDDIKLILAPGGKFASENIASWTLIIQALTDLQTISSNEYQLVISLHPGDRTPFAQDSKSFQNLDIYGELISNSPIQTCIINSSLLTASEVIPGVDLIIEFGGSMGVEGAYHRIPVICLAFETIFRRYERVTGTRDLEVVENGSAKLVIADVEELARTIASLLTPSGFDPIRKHQESNYVLPTRPGLALELISTVIDQFI